MAKVLIPLAPGCEELEAVTMIDLLRRAGIEVTTAGLEPGPVTASRGTVLVPDKPLEDVAGEDFDLIALPGGLPGATHLQQNATVQTLLRDMAKAGKYTAAICAAPKALASAGLLEGKRATCCPGSLNQLELGSTVLVDDAVVIDGTVVTSKGPGTAMDFALTLIELLSGKETRLEVEQGLQRT